ncbi:hypothetical protein B0O99DRAFT_708673 [Bisporella sp. PMI_857]|nr:hypothetical protein B0O99DRAFT_708673 [Bisporella sp. PMI_857]
MALYETHAGDGQSSCDDLTMVNETMAICTNIDRDMSNLAGGSIYSLSSVDTAHSDCDQDAGYEAAPRDDRRDPSNMSPLLKMQRSKNSAVTEIPSPSREEATLPGIARRPRVPWYINIISDWWLEYLSTICVVGMFALMVVTLWTYNGRNLAEWPVFVSLNVLVAIQATVMKSAMLLVISQVKERVDQFTDRAPTISLGAMVTVLAIGLDPFTQQVIRYYTKNSEIPLATATVPKTNYFAGSGGIIGLQQATAAGIFATDYIPLPAQCPSGMCAFDEPYHSVAYCSSCKDETANIDIKCPQTAVPPMVSQPCNYTLKAKESLTVWPDNGTYYLSPYGYSRSPSLSAQYSQESNEYFFLFNYTTVKRSVSGDCEGASCIGAVSCQINGCVRSYTGLVNSSSVVESIIATADKWWPAFTSNDQTWAMVNVQCAGPTAVREMLSLGVIYEANTTQWVGFSEPGVVNDKGQQYDSPILASIPKKCVYRLSTSITSNIQDWLRIYLTGEVLAIFEDPVDKYHKTEANEDPKSLRAIHSWEGSAQLVNLMGSEGASFQTINKSMAGIANAITVYFRQHGHPGYSEPANGKVLSSQTFVHVRWSWLVLPAALVGSTVIFFIQTIRTAIAMQEQDMGHNWKSSVWPLLFGEVEPNTGRLEDMKDMEKMAKVLQGKMQWTDVGWRLSTNQAQNN